MKISYINMVGELCEKVGVDIKSVAKGIGSDMRIGNQFFEAGIGYGGSCFPKDVKAFIKIGENYGLDFKLLKATENINYKCRENFLEKIENILWINKNKNIAIWGLAFKANTDDIREAPSLDIIKRISNKGANLKLYDPQASTNFKKIFPEEDSITYFNDKYEAVKDADALIILIEWEEFKKADLKIVKDLMRIPIIIDGRNIYNKEDIEEFEYYGVGRDRFDRLEIS